MRRYVVDASVAVKWFLPESGQDAARRLLTDERTLFAPDLIFSEVGSVLWKRVRAGQIREPEAEVVLRSMGALSWTVAPSWPLVSSAFVIACKAQRSVYDSLYLALAVREAAVMVTADEKLLDALQGTALAPYAGHLEDIA